MSASPDSGSGNPANAAAEAATDAAFANPLGSLSWTLPAADAGSATVDDAARWPLAADVAASLSGAGPRPSRQLLSKGELLYHHGDAASWAFLVEAGLVALSMAARPGRERIIGLAGPGDLVGIHNSGQSHYLDSATALSQEVSVFRVAAADRADSGSHYSELLNEASLLHLQRLTDQLEDTELPVPARLARTFLRLAERFGQSNDSGATRLTLPLTHDTLAAMVGAARETTSTTVQQLRDLGLVTGTRGRYVVQRTALQEFATQAAMA